MAKKLQPRATFAARPGTRNLRWPMQTSREHVYLAGAWTASDWPATMEAAVRSGVGAAEAVDGAEIERLEQEQAQRTDAIHGRINRVRYQSEANPDQTFHQYQPGQTNLIGRFGLKRMKVQVRRVQKRRGLFGNRRRETGMGVAERGDADARDQIEISTSIEVVEK